MNPRHRLWALAAGSLLAACGGKKEEVPAAASSQPTASATATVTATATATAAPPAKPPSWLAGVPVKPVTAKPGERVWNGSPYPNAENVSFGIAEVDSVQGNTATVASLMRQLGMLTRDDKIAPKRPFTPGLFILPARGVDVVKPKPKDWVITPIFGYRTGIAQITKVEGKIATIKYVNFDKVAEETTEYVEPLRTGIVPFAFVAMKKGDKMMEAIVLAVEGEQVFGVDDQGTVLKAAKSDVKPLKIEWKDRKAGSKVTVLDYTGAVETAIDKVTETKWVYEVKVNGATRKVPFSAVVDKI